jgi:TetR/AcrR family transcriptional regulator
MENRNPRINDSSRSGFPLEGSSDNGASHVPRISRRERERLRHRDEILKAAEELFARFGFEKTGVKQIAERAELSVGQIYNHFEGKEEIFRELIEGHLRELHERGTEACAPDDPPLHQLRCRIEAAVAHFKEHRDFLVIYHNENPLALEGMIKEEIRRNREIVAELFDEAMERGEIPREDPHVLAAVLIGAAHRLLDMFTEMDDRYAFDEVPGILGRMILEPLEERQRHATPMEDD